ncbi:MAG: sigma-54 dependent transcriptional regulator, partial [Muribaculaceae bacterium]|nr:sigma-54 dependent transcriptional regulator [Muribaculaceae bacterium]
GESPAVLSGIAPVKRVAPTSASVLITGENGTGKELIAQTLHRNSQRSDKPFVKVNLGGVSTSLFESEMFGHRRGAFTGAVADRKGRFELAHTGTIFLDEIGDLDLSSQVKLLRVLQEQTFEPLGDSRSRKVDVRVISATNAPLASMVAERTFREDLFYRLNLITVHVPPLRERAADIPLLVRYFAAAIASGSGSEPVEFTADAMERLCRLPYPGNIRELKNLVERSILVSGKTRVDVADLNLTEMQQPVKAVTLSDNERQIIIKALHDAQGNMSQAAATLGISRQALYRKMEKLHIQRQ